ncbi:MAG TPA: PVC-type heme-binding CxxCH protein [Tepidisphaeraceae bacterium]
MRAKSRLALAVGSVLLSCCAVSTQAGRLIADNEAYDPAGEQKQLHVPPGFEVQLVASEPDIHKPINIAFDDRGRLWVTDTVEYPFPAAEGAKTRDTVKILDDFGPDGKARKITTFADNLNIPVGVLPRGDNSVIVYSIPGVWHMTDTTGSGHADQRKLLLGSKFGHDDTHGQTGSFTEGYDGWVYAVHGFRNTSTITASDGSSITLQSGNTYRFKPDGSHVEQFTHGQVNPFGMCLDPLGNLFTSDCETMPIALMIRESYHPSFGKPDDGLGFEPEMCDHMYGSTAIAGLCDYVADQFPAEYHNRMFVGNVVTAKINAAQLSPRGSGFHADDSPNFIESDDQWFRPVCIKLGPDGALYVADFYNRIIGHYEVDLHHPGRDKQKGRIWRIVYKGNAAQAPAPVQFDLTKQSVPQLVEDLANTNLTIRMLAMNRLADTIGKPAIDPVRQMVSETKNPFQKAHGLWVLYRLGALDPDMLKSACADPDPVIREHAMRMVGETAKWEAGQRELALRGLTDSDPLVRRVSAEALARHPQFENIRPLLALRQRMDNDPDLTYGVRIALRDQLQQDGVGKQIAAATWSAEDERDLADAAAGATSPDAAAVLLHYVQHADVPHDVLAKDLRTIARAVPADQVEELARFVQEKFAGDLDQQLESFKSMQEGLAQRGLVPGQAVRAWGTQLAGRILSDTSTQQEPWTFHPVEGSDDQRSPWGVQTRKSADKDASSAFLSSNVHGETLTGVARSPAFLIPEKLSFYLAGHNGPPGKKALSKNIVCLRDAQTGEVLAKKAPPRNDVAQKVTWNLSKYAGRKGYFEATDGDPGKAYAWLAFGRFDPPVIEVPGSGVRLLSAIDIADALHLTPLGKQIEAVLARTSIESDVRAAAARALGSIDAPSHVEALAKVVRDTAAPDAVREAAGNSLGTVGSPDASSAVVEAMHAAPQKLQLALAKALASTPSGAEVLLDAIQSGKASAQLLQDANVRERLAVAKPANLDARVAELTKGLPAADVEIQKMIDLRAMTFKPAKADAARGKLVFQKNCVVCHMIGGQGAHVGPQLDGIGARGVPRLCEDILDPSRNVDVAFRYSTFVLADGTVIAGIPRREEGQTLTVADSTGKEVAIDKSKITRRVESKLSLMPSNFGEVIPAGDFNDLLAYLLSTAKP